MTILVDWQIKDLIEKTQCVHLIDDKGNIAPIEEENIQANSLDVFLDHQLLFEQEHGWETVDLKKEGILIQPNAFFLGNTIERFKLPLDISIEFRLTSGLARKGLAHSIAINLAPGFHGALTLELKSYCQLHTIHFFEGMKIGQLIFHQHDVCKKPYNGKYNGDISVSKSKD